MVIKLSLKTRIELCRYWGDQFNYARTISIVFFIYHTFCKFYRRNIYYAETRTWNILPQIPPQLLRQRQFEIKTVLLVFT